MQRMMIFFVTVLLGIQLTIGLVEARDKSIVEMTKTPTISTDDNTGLVEKTTRVADSTTKRQARRKVATQDEWIRVALEEIETLEENDTPLTGESRIFVEEQIEPEDDLNVKSLDTRDMDYLKKRDGNFVGYFQIPKTDISVPIYRIDASSWIDPTSIAQSYTNKKNTAVLLPDWEPFVVIADHVDQSFKRLHEVGVGTTAIIKWYDNTFTKMQCVETGIGINDSTQIIDENNSSWDTWKCDFVTYTCDNSIKDGVFYAKWVYSE